ncbi:MAG TPA: hypothetical protein VGQ80_04765, partial [Acidimicrobiia bacterium]|nr:hypothetical protein [Acidimicrobiia bacterium]
VLGLVVLPGSAAFARPAGPPRRTVFEGPVPRAQCGPGSSPETALQGQVPLADRKSGRSSQGYSCNLDLAGRYGPSAGFEGAEWQMAWYDHCAYYDTRYFGTQQRRGTVVVDVSDPARPRYSTNLTTGAMIDPWESLKVNEARGLLAGVFVADVQGAGFFDVYDVKDDCAHPKLLASVPVNGLGHEGGWVPDGKTYYATGIASMVTAIDVADPLAPKPIAAYFVPSAIHGLGVSEDGRRLYLAHMNPDLATAVVDGRPNSTAGNGLGIYDVSEIQSRRPHPQVRPVGTALWTDGQAGQHAIPFISHGHPYVVFVDELSQGGARIIDVADERRPRVLTKLKTEIQMPENLDTANRDTRRPPEENHGLVPGSFGYDAHYCSIDRPADPTIVACSEFQSGLRVFDIRDVRHPREIAYFNPGGDGHRQPGSFGGTYAGYTSAQPRILPERGEIWFTDQDRGFYVVRIANGIWPFVP